MAVWLTVSEAEAAGTRFKIETGLNKLRPLIFSQRNPGVSNVPLRKRVTLRVMLTVGGSGWLIIIIG
jgi:hypothetical protein